MTEKIDFIKLEQQAYEAGLAASSAIKQELNANMLEKAYPLDYYKIPLDRTFNNFMINKLLNEFFR